MGRALHVTGSAIRSPRTHVIAAGLAIIGLPGLTHIACDTGSNAPPPSPARAPLDVRARPNILLLVAEDLSPRIGALGDAVARTPNIDELAAEGTRYTHVFTTAGVCAPSRAALITGVPAIETGALHMRTMTRGYRAVPPAHVKAFPELLRGAGYYTFTDTKLDYQFSGPTSGSGPFTIWDDEGTGTHWRNRATGQPFFGMINFMETHESAIFPRPAWPRSGAHLALQGLQLYLHRGHESVTDPAEVRLPPYYPDTEAIRRDVARHYDHIHRMDEVVGRIMDELETDGLLDSTIVVWTTDHGDGLPRAKRTLFDSGLHVPLVIRWPEGTRPTDRPRGGSDDRLVSFIDLAPSLLTWAGVEVPAHMRGVRFAGAKTDPPPAYAFAARDRIDQIEDHQRAARDRRFKYVRHGHAGEPGAQRLAFRDNADIMRELWRLREAGELDANAEIWFGPKPEEALYDTWTDPHEIDNLVDQGTHAQTLARMRAALDRWLVDTVDLGEIDEDSLKERFWPGGEEPMTMAPTIRFEQHGEDRKAGHALAHIESSTPGASVGVRVRGANADGYALYTGPVDVEAGMTLEAKAVRYGFGESEVARATAPSAHEGDGP